MGSKCAHLILIAACHQSETDPSSTMVLSEPTWLFGVLVSLSSFKLVVLAAIRGKKPRHTRGVGRVSGIVLYPVKSCRGLQLTEVGITQSGLVDTTTGLHDRYGH